MLPRNMSHFISQYDTVILSTFTALGRMQSNTISIQSRTQCLYNMHVLLYIALFGLAP